MIANGPSFWRVVGALLIASRRRAMGRVRRQLRLSRRRKAFSFAAWPAIGFLLGCLLGVAFHAAVALEIFAVNNAAARAEAQAHGETVVESWFYKRIDLNEQLANLDPGRRKAATRDEQSVVASEASRIVQHHGGDPRRVAGELRARIDAHGSGLADEAELWRQPFALPEALTLALFVWWMLVLLCQGEGAQLDAPMARHPMWEWLFSHPAPPSAIFFAEMLAPIAANPLFVTAPILPGALFALAYGWPIGIAGAILAGIPLAVALACLGKALEIRIVLGFGPRVRGAALGLMSWFGFASMMVTLFLAGALFDNADRVARALAPLAVLPWPPTRALLGFGAQGDLAFWRGLALDIPFAVALTAVAVFVSVRSARLGLAGRFATAPAARATSPARWGRHPLYRREFLWFTRDGSAVVQAVLVPLSLAAIQAFNLRGLFSHALTSWNGVCGAAILFGTYFLLVLGPKSLASEGQALWIALTWPQGLEDLLKTKARLWASIASVIVLLALAAAAWSFPGDVGWIALTGVLWLAFSRSLAEKVVTLATTTTSSGEPQKIPMGLRWAATLGSLSFAIGIMTQQWSLAIAGVVYSTLTAAAMWQNFRFRLPFLFDPWSETAPPPPTLLNAMISISVMIEAASIVAALATAVLGRDSAAVITAASYGACALIVCTGVVYFLRAKNVSLSGIVQWGAAPSAGATAAWIAAGLLAGAALGGLAHLYLAALAWFPPAAEALEKGRATMESVPHARASYFVMAVAFAPFAEELLFRGLLFRALDREWGGARAVAGAAAFFAVYHPLLSWPPVFALGALSAVLFRRGRTLGSSVAAHVAYNAVVLGF